ncbi:phospholipase D family protein [Ferrimonas gelatinilytica]
MKLFASKLPQALWLLLLQLWLIPGLSGCSSAPPEPPEGFELNWQGQTVPGEVFLIPTAPQSLAYRLEAIDQATEFIDITYFTWNHDVSGIYVYHALLQAAQRGVKVRVLLDDLLVFNDRWLKDLDQHPNMDIRIFNPFDVRHTGWFTRAFNFQFRKKALNHRMHQKYFNVDGELLIIGGRNIGDDYFGLSDSANFFDLDLLVRGESLRQFEANFELFWRHEESVPVDQVLSGEPSEQQSLFLEDFQEMKDEHPDVVRAIAEVRAALPEPDYISALVTPAFDDMEKFEDSLPYFRRRIEQFLLTYPTQHKELLISTPYMIPNGDEFTATQAFLENGADVILLTNSAASNDSGFVAAYYDKYRKPLLEMGVDIYEYDSEAVHPPYLHQATTYYHNKAFVIDDWLSYIGSSNFDPRSDHLNFEMGMMIESQEFAEALSEYLLLSQLDNFWHVTLDEEGNPQWEKGQVIEHTNPRTAPIRALPAWFYRLFNIQHDI